MTYTAQFTAVLRSYAVSFDACGGTVTPDQNNYCGLGTTSAYVKGAYFPSSQLGVRAHIQHLLAYAISL